MTTIPPIEQDVDAHYTAHAQALHDSVQPHLPYTFRDGFVLCTIKAVEQDGWRFSILDAEASFDGQPVPLDLPLHYVNATTLSPLTPLVDVHGHVSATVRHVVRQAQTPREAEQTS